MRLERDDEKKCWIHKAKINRLSISYRTLAFHQQERKAVEGKPQGDADVTALN